MAIVFLLVQHKFVQRKKHGHNCEGALTEPCSRNILSTSGDSGEAVHVASKCWKMIRT